VYNSVIDGRGGLKNIRGVPNVTLPNEKIWLLELTNLGRFC